MTTLTDLTTTSGIVNDLIFINTVIDPTGTGTFNSFLAIQNDPTESGYNTSGGTPLDDKSDNSVHTGAVLLSAFTLVNADGTAWDGIQPSYREIILDIGENGAAGSATANISLDAFQLYIAGQGNLLDTTDQLPSTTNGLTSGGATLVYDLGDNPVLLSDHSSGQGSADYRILIPDSFFTAQGATDQSYVYLYTKFSQSGGSFEEFGTGGGSTGSQPTAELSIDKLTNGLDDGGNVLVGETVTWTYQVTNTGDGAVSKVVVTDDNGTAAAGDDFNPTAVLGADHIHNVGDTNNDGLLEHGETWQYTATGTATAGDYTNTGTATGTGPVNGVSTPLTASDLSHYFGLNPHLTIDKVTADLGDDDTVDGTPGDGKTILVGENIQWQYTVHNDGNIELTNVVVVDDNGTADTGDDIVVGTIAALAAGASTTLTLDGIAQAGSYHNNATATADPVADTAGHTATASGTDDSSYFGANPEIAINKTTTGYDTPSHTVTGDGVSILAGYGVTWTYTVTLGGDDNVPLSHIVVGDDRLGTLYNDGVLTAGVTFSGDDGDNVLDNGETWTFTASGVTTLGSYSNTGTTTGSYTDSAGHVGTTTATDQSSYIGTFVEQGRTLTQGFWGSHTDAWDNITGNEGNPTKSAVKSGVLSGLDVNPSTGSHSGDLLLGDSNGDGIANDDHDLWISIKLAASIESASTSGDARMIMLQQAIAAQLNIDNGATQPNNLIDEAVMWLTNQGSWSSAGVNVATGGPVSNGFGGVVQTVSENGAHTALAGTSVSTSSAAWKTYVDVTQPASITDWNGGKEADGEGLKNALMWWNDGHLVTSGAGQVAYDPDGTGSGGPNPATVQLNTLDEFWLTLHQQTSLTGIA